MEEPTQNESVRYVLWITIATIVVIADQVTKWAIVQWIDLYARPVPVNSFINLVHLQNKGAAWSFLAEAGGWQRWFLAGLAAVVSAVLVVWLWRIRGAGQLVLSAGLSLVLGGAVGNLIDRVRLGHVTDFIQVWLGDKLGYFPAFNVADAAISVGAAFLLFDAFFLAEK